MRAARSRHMAWCFIDAKIDGKFCRQIFVAKPIYFA
jgi:hypothetical protein